MNKLGVLVVVVGAIACGGNGSGPLTTRGAMEACQDLCEADAECDATPEPIDQCVTECMGTLGGTGYGRDAINDYVDCTVATPCPDRSESACIHACTPTSAHEAYEARCREFYMQCTGTSGPTVDAVCETTPAQSGETGLICLFAPVVMDELRACFDGPCPNVQTCFQDVLQRYGLNGR